MARRLLALALTASLLLVTLPREARASGGASLPNGYFYAEASGVADPARGYSVTDEDGVLLWSEFQRLGGVPALGYPVSRRFVRDGFVVQAFQKALLQWNPGAGAARFANLFDLLHEAGLDPWLASEHLIPPAMAFPGEAGLTWERVVARHLALLDQVPAIKARYYAEPDPTERFGLPVGLADHGHVIVLRAQRAAFQLWKEDVPWAYAGDVTVVNAGDLAKSAGLFPLFAVVPEAAPWSGARSPEAELAGLPPDAARVAPLLRPAIVRVISPDVGQGSGFFFDPRGFVATTSHVVGSASRVQISLHTGETLEGRVLGSDLWSDLAVVKVDGRVFPTLVLGKSDGVDAGQQVLAFGYAPALPDLPALRTGFVVGLSRLLRANGQLSNELLHTDARLQPGDSGGPLLDLNGQVIAVNAALVVSRQAAAPVVTASFPINQAKPILDRLASTGATDRPWLGLIGYSIVPDLVPNGRPGSERGVLVVGVLPRSPAATAGLRVGDVIIAADGRPIARLADLLSVVSGSVGRQVDLLVTDNGGSRQVQVTIQS